MAKAEYGIIITELKGSIGGCTFQQNSSGKIVRLKPRPLKKQTTAQSEKHSFVAYINNKWHQLTVIQQDVWNVYAGINQKIDKFGNNKNLTGYNWHYSINFNILAFGGAYVNAPPAYTLPTAIPTTTMTIDVDKIQIDFAPNWNPATSGIIIYATPPIQTSSTNFDRDLKLIDVGNIGNVANINITADWDTATGLTWNGLWSSGGFNLGILLIPIQTASGNAGSPVRYIKTV